MLLTDEIRAALAGQDMACDAARAGLVIAAAAAAGPEPRPLAIAGAGLSLEPGMGFAVSRGVAVLPIMGLLTPSRSWLTDLLGWSTYSGISAAAGELAQSDDVAAVVLHVDCPGGMVLGCADAHAAVAELAARKPVYAVIAPLAASAAYWVISPAARIAISAGGVAGSIGTMARASSPVGPDSYGERAHEIRSSSARAKNPDPNTDHGLAAIRTGLDAAEASFLAAVAAGRNIPEAEIRARLSLTDDPQDGGATWTGQAAVDRGLADVVEATAASYDRIFADHAPRLSAPGRGRARTRAAEVTRIRARA